MSAMRNHGLIEFKGMVKRGLMYLNSDKLDADEVQDTINYILKWLLELEEERRGLK